MPKINERILDSNDLKEKEQEEAEELANTKLVPSMQEYGEIRVPKTWKNPPKLTDLKHDILFATIEHDNIVAEITEYLDYYHTTPGVGRPHKIQGRSNAQPQSIRKAAEWRYAHLSEPFLDSPDIFKGEPTTGMDVEGTKQTEMILNHQFKHQIGLVEFIDAYIKDLVDTGTAIIRTSWEEKELSSEEEQDVVKYVDAPELATEYQQLIMLMKQDPDLFNRNHEPELVQSLKISIEEGRPVKRVKIKTEQVTIVETIKNQPKLEICDYRDVVPDPTCRGKQEDMKFCGFRLRTTKADLKADPRYSNVEDILVTAAVSIHREDSIEANSEGIDQDSETFQFKDPNRQPIEGVEYWGFIDVNESGTLTPVVLTWFGDVLVRAEENPYPDKKIPFTFVPYLKRRNSLYGEPDGILLQEDQKVSGAITRGVVDILAKNANGQRGVPKGSLDLSNLILYREGKDYEFNPTTQMGRDGLVQITKFPEIPQSAIAVQQLAENNIKEMTGTVQGSGSQDQGGNLGTQKEPAQGGMTKASRRELGILRRVANGVIEVGHKICAMNKEFLDEEEVIRITDNKFAIISRQELDCRYDLSLSISTAEDDSTKAQELAFLLQTSSSVMDEAFTRELLADIAELRRMPGKADKYRDYEPAPDPFAQKTRELEIAKLAAEIAEIESRTNENHAEAERELANAENLREQAALAKAKAEAIELKYLEDDTGLTHERELEKQGAQADGNIRLEKVKQGTNSDEGDKKTIDNLQDNLTLADDPSTNSADFNDTSVSPDESKAISNSSPEALLDELSDIGTEKDVL